MYYMHFVYLMDLLQTENIDIMIYQSSAYYKDGERSGREQPR